MSREELADEGQQEDTDEVDVWLSQYDMDHLRGGQPVFKAGRGETVIVLRTEREVYADE